MSEWERVGGSKAGRGDDTRNADPPNSPKTSKKWPGLKNIDFLLKSIRKSTVSRAGASGSERQGAAGTEKVSISY